MTISEFKIKLKTNPSTINFAESMQVIDDNYNFIPSAFTNGEIENKAGENVCSCKLFAFAKLQHFTKEETLNCFGEHYKSVLEDENGESHQNIRNFMKYGFKGLKFEGTTLQLKNKA